MSPLPQNALAAQSTGIDTLWFRHHEDTQWQPISVWTRDNQPLWVAADRASTIVFGAHSDDIATGAAHLCERVGGVIDIVVTDGAGNRLPTGMTAADIVAMRELEEIEVAERAGFEAVVFLRYTSAEVRDLTNPVPTRSFVDLAANFESIITHNALDFHATHLAVLARVVDAVSMLQPNERPKELLGVEIWGSCDWVERSRLRYEPVHNVADIAELMSVYATQNAAQGYDIGVPGRLRANATFADPYARRTAEGIVRLIDLSELIGAGIEDVAGFISTLHSEAYERQLAVLAGLRRGG